VKPKEDTEPTKYYMATKVHNTYVEAMKGLGKTTKVGQWVDKWEHAMKLIEKHKLPQASNGLWLKDLAQAIRPLSDTMCLMYSNQASDALRNKPVYSGREHKALDCGVNT
jgi:glycogen debranching enzyme